jgi:hypothetical protein
MAGLLEPISQLGLPHEHDLNEILVIALKVGEHPDPLQSIIGKVLCFVNDQKDLLVLGIFFDEKLIKNFQIYGLASRLEFQFKGLQDQIEQFIRANLGVKYYGDFLFGFKLIHDMPDKGGFARSHFTGEKNDPDIFHETIFQVGQCVLVDGTHVEIAWIGNNLKGLFCEAVKVFVHYFNNRLE